jgi:hypothetical protein
MFAQGDRKWKADSHIQVYRYDTDGGFLVYILNTGLLYNFKAVYYSNGIRHDNIFGNGFTIMDFNYTVGTYGNIQRVKELL